jgi:hypothetical protein
VIEAISVSFWEGITMEYLGHILVASILGLLATAFTVPWLLA